MQLSEHFSLEELTFSESALRRGIDNTPDSQSQANLNRLCTELLEPARWLLGVPFHVNSGYRCSPLNALVGGAKNSAHMDGRAADVVPQGMDLRAAFDEIRASSLPFDQVIMECNAWLHLAIAEGEPRREALTASGGPGAWEYTVIS